MDKLLVIGVDTLAGGNLAVTLADRCEVVGISQTIGFELDDCRILCGELDRADELTEIVAAEQPRCIVYCGPSCAAGWDGSRDLEETVEARRAKAVEQAAEKCGGRMVLLSTDAVFGGPRLFHHETFPTSPIGPAAAARNVEQALTANESLILRSHLFGWSPGGESYAERTWTALAEGCQPIASGTSYATPILASDAAEFVWQAYRRRLSGLYHLGGAERISQWQFAAVLERSRGGSVAKSRQPAASAPNILPVGEETSLDSRRLQRALSRPLPLVNEGINRFIEQAENGYRQRLQGGSAPKIAELAAA